jgi:hypothetical protein
MQLTVVLLSFSSFKDGQPGIPPGKENLNRASVESVMISMAYGSYPINASLRLPALPYFLNRQALAFT